MKPASCRWYSERAREEGERFRREMAGNAPMVVAMKGANLTLKFLDDIPLEESDICEAINGSSV